VIEHPGCHDRVEGNVVERKIAGVADHCLDAATGGEFDHPGGLVHTGHRNLELVGDAGGQRTGAAANLQHVLRPPLTKSGQHDILRRQPVGRRVPDRGAGTEAGLRSVLLAYEAGIGALITHASTLQTDRSSTP
jgi:hypothetical protein